MRRLAGLLACVVLLSGTTGAATLDAFVHAGQGHSHHESNGGPEPQGPECVLCVAAGVMAMALVVAPAVSATQAAFDGDVVPLVSRAVHATTYYLTPPGRGPPAS
jgi:hypothetical protein